MITAFSKLHWKQVAAYKRTGDCPVCSGKVIVSGYNDLFTCYPDLMNDWDFNKNDADGISPHELSSGTHLKVWWKCSKCEHEWRAQVYSRTGSGTGCPACAGKVVVPGYNDLEMRFPNIAAEWDRDRNDKKPSEVVPFSHEKVYWICPNGHSYDMPISHRTSEKLRYNCPYCAHQRCESGVIDLATLYPELLEEWDYEKNADIGLFPDQITAHSQKKAHWICKTCGEKWGAQISKRTQGRGCLVCSGQKVIAGKNDFASIYPMLSRDWDYDKNDVTPSEIFPHSNRKYHWKCHVCGGEWLQSVSHRTREKASSCPYCTNQKVLPGYNDLATRCPNLIEEWDYDKNKILPSEILYCSSSKAYWKCSHGHEYEAVIRSRSIGHTSCRRCHKGQQDSIFERFVYWVAVVLFGLDKVIAHDMDLIGKELDIYIPHLKIAIEPGSWFWHKNKIENDYLKYTMCQDKGVNLIIVYDGIKDDEVDVQYPCMEIQEDLGLYNNKDKAIQVVKRILSPYVVFDLPIEQMYNIFDNALAKKIDMRVGE